MRSIYILGWHMHVTRMMRKVRPIGLETLLPICTVTYNIIIRYSCLYTVLHACIATYILLPVLEHFNSLSTCSARLPSPASEPRIASHNASRVGLVGCSFVGHWTHCSSNVQRKLPGEDMNSERLQLICLNSDGTNPSPSPISFHLSLKLCIRFKSVAMSLSVNTRSVGALNAVEEYYRNKIIILILRKW